MHPLKRILTGLYRNVETVCIASSPRSGSTWLAESLVKIGSLDWVDEPLRMTDELRAAGFVARTYVRGDDSRVEAVMRDVLEGRVGYLQMYPRFRRRLLLKFVRLNRMMRWTVERFGLRANVLLIRHPCAVVSSQLAMGRRKDAVWARVTDPAPHIPDYLRDAVAAASRPNMSVQRVLAINWTVDNAISLVHEPPTSTRVSSYERLMEDRDRELRAICAHCRIPFRRVDTTVASSTASPDYRQDVQSNKWRQKLSAETREEIRDVVTTIMPEFERVRQDLGLGEW